MKIRILVAVDRCGRMHAARIYDGELGLRDAQRCLLDCDIDYESIQYRIVEAEVPCWQEPPVPVVQGEATVIDARQPRGGGEGNRG